VEQRRHVGAYEILGELASGGMATVFIARHARLGRVVALKILHPHYQQDGSLRIRFVDEARIQANLRHPNILEVQDILELPDASGMVMELLDGCTLSAYYRKVAKPLLLPQALSLFIRLADALAHAHDLGIVHRDLKPSNIYLHRQGKEAVPKLMDFGIAKLKNMPTEGQMTAAGSMLGTPQYMAPEQFEDSSRVDTRADVYAMGVMLYEACSGVMPFEGDAITQIMRDVLTRDPVPPSSVRADFHRGMEQIILTCLKKDRTFRYQSANELKAALEKVALDAGTAPIPASAVPSMDFKSHGIDITSLITSAHTRPSTGADPSTEKTEDPPSEEEMMAMAVRGTDTAIPIAPPAPPRPAPASPLPPTAREVPSSRGSAKGFAWALIALLVVAGGLGGLYFSGTIARWMGNETGAPAEGTTPGNGTAGSETPADSSAARASDSPDGKGARQGTSAPTTGAPVPPSEADQGPRPGDGTKEGASGAPGPQHLDPLPTADGLVLGKPCTDPSVPPDVAHYMAARLSAGWHGRRLSFLPPEQLALYDLKPEDLERFKPLLASDPLVKELGKLSQDAVRAFKDGPLDRAHLAKVRQAIDRDPEAPRYLEAKTVLLCEGRLATLKGETEVAGTMMSQVLAEKGVSMDTFSRLDATWESDALLKAELYSRALCCLMQKAPAR
jgi:serine/threonine-protein kinase